VVGSKIVGVVIIGIFVIVVGYFFLTTSVNAPGVIPDNVTGELREIYEFAQTFEGDAALEKIPCYCGCKFEGHLHTRHCFWKDDGTFDKHGITCSVCLDIAKKTKLRMEEGVGICDIRDEIDAFYAPNAELGTSTPYPAECV
jgi:hypothetical protein